MGVNILLQYIIVCDFYLACRLYKWLQFLHVHNFFIAYTILFYYNPIGNDKMNICISS